VCSHQATHLSSQVLNLHRNQVSSPLVSQQVSLRDNQLDSQQDSQPPIPPVSLPDCLLHSPRCNPLGSRPVSPPGSQPADRRCNLPDSHLVSLVGSLHRSPVRSLQANQWRDHRVSRLYSPHRNHHCSLLVIHHPYLPDSLRPSRQDNQVGSQPCSLQGCPPGSQQVSRRCSLLRSRHCSHSVILRRCLPDNLLLNRRDSQVGSQPCSLQGCPAGSHQVSRRCSHHRSRHCSHLVIHRRCLPDSLLLNQRDSQVGSQPCSLQGCPAGSHQVSRRCSHLVIHRRRLPDSLLLNRLDSQVGSQPCNLLGCPAGSHQVGRRCSHHRSRHCSHLVIRRRCLPDSLLLNRRSIQVGNQLRSLLGCLAGAHQVSRLFSPHRGHRCSHLAIHHLCPPDSPVASRRSNQVGSQPCSLPEYLLGIRRNARAVHLLLVRQ
jgi:hypothetical protein